ncbi:MAG: alpha/beta hydrolase [Chloroflexi bacterium]|nr:alpha/beta hydrolase [Chloroflexota bacterium]
MATLHEAAAAAGVPFEEPRTPLERDFDTGEINLHYLEWGRAGAPPVLLLHGFAQTAHSWDFVALSLSDFYRVFAVDARGHGDSDWSAVHDYSRDAHLRDLDALLGHLRFKSVAAIGLSMGGRTAYALAARHPGVVKALVIVDVGPVIMASGRARIRNFVQLPDERDSYEDFVRAVHAYQPLRSVDQIRATLRHNVRQTPNGKWTWKYDRVLRDPNFRRPASSPDEEWALIKSIECPTLVVRGEMSDVLSSETATEMTKAIRNADYAEVVGAGHIVPGDNPAGFIHAVRPWLTARYQ